MKREPKQIADEWLVLRSQEGSAPALDALLRKWHRPLWLRACRLTGDEEIARDITQETLLAIARSIRKLDDPARYRAWAFQIASNKSRDWVRQRGESGNIPTPFRTRRSVKAPTGRTPVATIASRRCATRCSICHPGSAKFFICTTNSASLSSKSPRPSRSRSAPSNHDCTRRAKF